MNTVRKGGRPMRRSTIVVGVVAALVVIGGVALAEDVIPSFVPADQQVPVPTPDKGQQVAVIEVALRADGEKATGEVRSATVIDGFAPKVVARSAGDWQVLVKGEHELKYLIPNPLLDIEAESEKDDPKDPYDQVQLGTYDWTLIVPMYDLGVSLGATSVEVSDVASGNVIFTTELKRQ
jgi:hypothetical protein